MGMLRDDPGGHFAAGYHDGAAGRAFNPPADNVREEAADLNPFDDRLAIKTVCPNCGAVDWFEWKFLGKLTDPVCGHTWYVGSGTYALIQIRAAFQFGRRFAKYITSGKSQSSTSAGEAAVGWLAKGLFWTMGALLGIGMRLEFGLLMTPIQAIVGLCQSHKSKAEVISRSIVVGVFVVAIGSMAYLIGHNSQAVVSARPRVDVSSRAQLRATGQPSQIPYPAEAVSHLFLAITLEDLSQVTALLNAGVDVNADYQGSGSSFLMRACQGKSLEIVEALLDRGANINYQGPLGRTALHQAVQDGFQHIEIIEALLARNANPNIPDQDGLTPFHVLASSYYKGIDYARIIRDFMAQGADVNVKTKEELTPLMEAARSGLPVTVEALLSAGADVNARTPDGKTASTFASDNREKRTLLWLCWPARLSHSVSRLRHCSGLFIYITTKSILDLRSGYPHPGCFSWICNHFFPPLRRALCSVCFPHYDNPRRIPSVSGPWPSRAPVRSADADEIAGLLHRLDSPMPGGQGVGEAVPRRHDHVPLRTG